MQHVDKIVARLRFYIVVFLVCLRVHVCEGPARCYGFLGCLTDQCHSSCRIDSAAFAQGTHLMSVVNRVQNAYVSYDWNGFCYSTERKNMHRLTGLGLGFNMRVSAIAFCTVPSVKLCIAGFSHAALSSLCFFYNPC